MATLAEMLRQGSFENPNNPYSSNLLANALRGSVSNAESLGRGAAVAPLGIFGDVNALARKYITPRLPAKVQAALESLPAAPTTEAILANIPRGTEARRESSGMEQLGAAMNPMGPIEAAKGVTKGLGAYGKLAGEAVNDAMIYGRGPLAEITPQPMRMVEQTKSTFKFPQEEAIKLAQERASMLGQSDNPSTRMLQQGYEDDWYHGSTGDITKFRQDLLGEATGAASAKKGFFFARDPQNPPASLTQKTNDPESIAFLKKLGKTDEEIAALNAVSMKGHGPETASGYAQIGGSREYKEAMRNANAAEKMGKWDEYEKQMGLAEDIAIGDQRYLQDLTAKYGDRRDEMLSTINESIYSKKLGQKESETLDAKVKELMPYGWYNSFDKSQIDTLKSKLVDLLGKDGASKALKNIDNFQSIKNERALAEKTQQGANVMPVALRYENPLVHDFGGSTYRDETYSDLIDKALAGGHDALLLKNTYDPGAGASKLVDVGVVFNPDQIRSRFAAFDPLRKTAATAAAAGLAAPDLLAKERK